MWMALTSLVGLFVAAYLSLYKLGYLGAITCTVGSCETVQMSKWATLLGLPVAVWGIGFYLLVLALTVAGTMGQLAESRGLSLTLLVLTGWGLVFSAWLTWLELFVIHAICQWCVVSAILATILFGLSIADWRQVRSLPPPELIEVE
jgi:uncharacterized membrane protein